MVGTTTNNRQRLPNPANNLSRKHFRVLASGLQLGTPTGDACL